jgi:tetratricopeptide (TPR) repeat protein
MVTDTIGIVMFDRNKYLEYQNEVNAYLSKEGSFSKVRKSPKLNNVEKKLMMARYLNRRSKHHMVLDMLSKINDTDDQFLKAEKYFLQAQTYSFLGHFEQSAKCNLHALEIYQQLMDRRGLFLVNYNLSVDYSRLGLRNLTEYYLNKAVNLKSLPSEVALIMRAMACYYMEQRNYELANIYIEKALNDVSTYGKLDQLNTYLVASDFWVSNREFNKAYDMLNQLHNSKNFALKARYQLERAMLKSIISNDKLELPPTNLEEGQYLQKWKLLISIQSGHTEMAKILWNEVRKLDPRLGEEFLGIDEGETAPLFTTYLRKLIKEKQPQKETCVSTKLKEGLAKELYSILVTSPVPIRKEELIEKLWKTSYFPELDNRFYKLVQRLKEQTNLNIINQSNAYYIS